MLGQQGQTLATAEIATRGLVAQWLAKAAGGDRFRGGLVAADEATMRRLLTLDPAEAGDGPALVREWAVACRRQFQADLGLAVGRLPLASLSGEAGQVHFALASAAGVRTMHVSSGIHPDIVGDFCAKHAINFVRLALLESASAATIM